MACIIFFRNCERSWDVACHKVPTWKDLMSSFVLAEREHSRVQEENKRDEKGVKRLCKLYMYQSLCRCEKPHIKEEKIIKLN